MKVVTLLGAIGYTEPSTFNEFCQGLGKDVPVTKQEWAEMFHMLDNCSTIGLIGIEKRKGCVIQLQLTEEGASYLKDNSSN